MDSKMIDFALRQIGEVNPLLSLIELKAIKYSNNTILFVFVF